MVKYSEKVDLSTWSIELLKALDDYLTRNGYSYSEECESLYKIRNEIPKAGKGGKVVSFKGIQYSINRWCFVHFIKTRKAISSKEAKIIYEPISVSVRNKKLLEPKKTEQKPMSKFQEEFDLLLESINCKDTYPEILKKLTEANSVYKENKKSAEFYSSILKTRYSIEWVLLNDFKIENGLGVIELQVCNRNNLVYAKFNTNNQDVAIKKLQEIKDAGVPLKMVRHNGSYQSCPTNETDKIYLHFSQSDLKQFIQIHSKLSATR